jgi:hypothetical protein
MRAMASMSGAGASSSGPTRTQAGVAPSGRAEPVPTLRTEEVAAKEVLDRVVDWSRRSRESFVDSDFPPASVSIGDGCGVKVKSGSSERVLEPHWCRPSVCRAVAHGGVVQTQGGGG